MNQVKTRLRTKLDLWRGLAFIVFFFDSSLLFKMSIEQRGPNYAEALILTLSLPVVILFLYLAHKVTEEFKKL